MIQVGHYNHYRHDSKTAMKPDPDYYNTDYWNRTSDIYLVRVALYQLS